MKSLLLLIYVISILPDQLKSDSFGHSIQLLVYNAENKDVDHVQWGVSIAPNPIEIDNVVQHSEVTIAISAAIDQLVFNRAVGEVSYEDFKENLRVNYFLNTTNPDINYMLDSYGGGTGMRNQTHLNFYKAISNEITDAFYENYRRNTSTNNYFLLVPLQFARLKEYFDAVVQNAPLNLTLTGNLYFMHHNKSLIITRINISVIILKTRHDSDYEAVALNANRTISPRMGLPIMQTPPSIAYCGHGGQMNKDGFCDCRDGFSGPACVFPCPSSAGGVITPESCQARKKSDECVFGIRWLFNKCDNGTVLFSKNSISLNMQRNNTELQIVMNITSSVTMLPKIKMKFQVEGIGQLEEEVVAEEYRFVNYTLTRLCRLINNSDCLKLRNLLPPFRPLTLTIWLTDERIAYITKESPEGPPQIAALVFNSQADLPLPPRLVITQNTDNITFSLTVPKDECSGMLVAFEIECVGGSNKLKQRLNVTHDQEDCRIKSIYDFVEITPTLFDMFSSKTCQARAENSVGWSGYSKPFEYRAPFCWPPVLVGLVLTIVFLIIYTAALHHIYPEWKELLKRHEWRKLLDIIFFQGNHSGNQKGNTTPVEDDSLLPAPVGPLEDQLLPASVGPLDG